jgi:PAS domain S-box-containing protein
VAGEDRLTEDLHDPAHAPDEIWFGDDAAPARATVYWILLVVLALGGFALRGGAPLPRTADLHLVTETFAVALAVVLGVLALVRYFTGRRRTFLFIGTGFVAAGVLDAAHLAIATGGLAATAPASVLETAAWSWLHARVFLALFLLVSLLTLRDGSRASDRGTSAVGVVGLATALTALTAVFFAVVQLRQVPAIHPAWAYPRPAELLPGAIFGLACLGYLRRGRWRYDAFEHWLVVSLLIAAAGHLFFMGLSPAPGDALDTGAHILKSISYVALLVGVVVSVYTTARREQRALEIIRAANDRLEDEVEVRAEAQSALQRSEARLRSFLDSARDLVFSVDGEGRILYANPAVAEGLGYADGDLVGSTLFDVVSSSLHRTLRTRLESVLAGDRVETLELEFVTTEGARIAASGSFSRYAREGESPVAQGIFRDVSAQRDADAERAATLANLEALIESTGDSIWSIDREQRLVTINSGFALALEARTGREPRVGDRPEEVFPEDDVEWYRELYERALTGERFSDLRIDIVGGETRMYEIFCQPIPAAAGYDGAVMFGRDVTRRIRAEEALRMAKDEAEAANRAKSQFLANMSHELRTPLNSVIGFANVLLKNRRGNLADQDLGFLDRILVNGRHLLALINEVLDLAKIEAGKMELTLEPVDLGRLARETAEQLEGQAREKRVRLDYDIPDEPVTIETDLARLRQVLINLVGNAIKFSEEGRVTLRLELDASGAPIALAVQDTGIGIAGDRLDAIFEAFEQAEGSTSRQFGGTGLGLTLSRSLCLLLGFDLEVESTLGEGSTFSIVMPRARRLDGPAPDSAEFGDAASRQEGGERSKPGDSGREEVEAAAVAVGGAALARRPERRDLRVLVVDDDEQSRLVLSHLLHDFGCSVALAESAAAGLASAHEHRPDLITLDLVMPDMDGWAMLDALKKSPELRDIPVVVVSGVDGGDYGRLLGAVDVIHKPVEREDLLRVLWRGLVRRQGGRVLVVEDDEDTRALLHEHLAAAGLAVTSAANGAEALEAVDREAPDAILLDLIMPAMDGLTFLRALREHPYHEGIPVVVLTAKDLEAEEQAYLDQAASSVIRKGDGVESELRRVLSRILPIPVD